MGIFKAYDVRGLYPSEVTEAIARRIGRAFVGFLGGPRGPRGEVRRIAVGRDMRESGVPLGEAVRAGIRDAGATAVDIGFVTTPLLYHAVGSNGLAGGIMVTASHNPAGYNGFKICREEGIPVGSDSGLAAIEAACADDDDAVPDEASRGAEETLSPLDPYIEHLRRFAGPLAERGDGPRLRVAFDCGNGAVGAILGRVLEEALPGVEPFALYWEPDGTFPNHEANPLEVENLHDVATLVRRDSLDLGIAFDGDGDRMVAVDDRGEPLPADRMTAILAAELLARQPGSKVVYDLRSSRAIAEDIRRLGGEPVKERVGHAFIKATMRRVGAPLGGELSGHFYFADHYYCDSALVATAKLLALLATGGQRLSELRKPIERYAQSGEVNFVVEDPDAKIEELAAAFGDGEQSRLDGISVDYEDWWFNVRKSNTEPKLRLNVEAADDDALRGRLGELRKILERRSS